MNTFWAVYFGAILALISQFIVEGVYADYRHKKRRKELLAMLEYLEDEEADDEDDDEDCC